MLSCFSENENKVELNDSNMVSNNAKKADVDDAENVSSDSNSKETQGKLTRLQFDWTKFTYLCFQPKWIHYQYLRNFRRENKSQTVRMSTLLRLSPLEMRESERKNWKKLKKQGSHEMVS